MVRMVRSGQDKESALDHETRKMIYNHITHYPGVAFSVLRDIFALPEGTLRYHLKYLERAESICSELEGGNRCYYPEKTETLMLNLVEGQGASHKLTEIQKRILMIIKQNPGINQAELIKRTKLNRFTVNYNMKKFISLGLVRKFDDGGRVFYEYITDSVMRHEIMKSLIIKLLNNEIDEKMFNELKEKLVNDSF
jgi:predicted transcriptional regulator